MSTPVTTLDQRFSDPKAAATEWDETRGALEAAQLFWISTVRADGRPHVTPLVAVWLDDTLHFCTGGAEQKYLNLTGNPQVILTTGSNQWQDGLDVVVEGEAVRVSDDKQLRRLAEAWTTKWEGQWEFGVSDGSFHHRPDGEPVYVFAVKPVKVLAFDKGKSSHTRHKF
jgi:nitroimidazol reductase NimA-like FMN-containing flavoprotein (pyridoxamine 5'-phosphate oxidase superfamily)